MILQPSDIDSSMEGLVDDEQLSVLSTLHNSFMDKAEKAKLAFESNQACAETVKKRLTKVKEGCAWKKAVTPLAETFFENDPENSLQVLKAIAIWAKGKLNEPNTTLSTLHFDLQKMALDKTADQSTTMLPVANSTVPDLNMCSNVLSSLGVPHLEQRCEVLCENLTSVQNVAAFVTKKLAILAGMLLK